MPQNDSRVVYWNRPSDCTLNLPNGNAVTLRSGSTAFWTKSAMSIRVELKRLIYLDICYDHSNKDMKIGYSDLVSYNPGRDVRVEFRNEGTLSAVHCHPTTPNGESAGTTSIEYNFNEEGENTRILSLGAPNWYYYCLSNRFPDDFDPNVPTAIPDSNNAKQVIFRSGRNIDSFMEERMFSGQLYGVLNDILLGLRRSQPFLREFNDLQNLAKTAILSQLNPDFSDVKKLPISEKMQEFLMP
jgi:hypothetical protein